MNSSFFWVMMHEWYFLLMKVIKSLVNLVTSPNPASIVTVCIETI
jgi:hypothetical protein